MTTRDYQVAGKANNEIEPEEMRRRINDSGRWIVGKNRLIEDCGGSKLYHIGGLGKPYENYRAFLPITHLDNVERLAAIKDFRDYCLKHNLPVEVYCQDIDKDKMKKARQLLSKLEAMQR